MNYNFTINKISNVIFVGKSDYNEKRLFFPNPLENNELIYHLSGSSTVHFNGKSVKTSPDTLRFLPKGENREYVVDVDDAGECIDVFFDTDVGISEEVFVVEIQNNRKIKALFKKLFYVWVTKNDGYYFECMSLLYNIFSLMQSRGYLSQNQYEKIKPAIDYINENFLKGKISVGHLADICKISESYLKKLFVKKFGLPPAKYIIQLRTNYACDLLQSGLYNITKVAEMCGYADIYYFSHQFKEYIGVSPTEYKRKQ